MKVRLDQLLVDRGLATGRDEAKRLILAGLIRVDGQPAGKPGRTHPAEARVERLSPPRPFVSRGGEKLAAALDRFGVDPSRSAFALDIGASTGGFTDCLLKRGAPRVAAVDTGRGQIHESLRRDPRVELFENTNARNLRPEDLGGRLADLIVIDVSFISLRLILPAMAAAAASGTAVIALVKPQFEAGRGSTGSDGVVRDPAIHRRVLRETLEWCAANGWRTGGLMASPLRGAEGNIEFLLLLSRGGEGGLDRESAVEAAMAEAYNPAVAGPSGPGDSGTEESSHRGEPRPPVDR